MTRSKRSSGEGSLFFSQAQKTWMAEIVLPDGTKKRKKNKLQRVVRSWLEIEKEALRRGTWVSTEYVLYGDFLDRYLKEVATHSLRPKTLESYTYVINKHIRPHLGQMRIVAIRPDHLSSLYAKVLESGLSKHTVRYLHRIIRKTLSIALNWGLVGRNVADSVTPPTPPMHEIKPLTVDEVKRLLKVLEGDRLYAFYALICTTGLRKGEALAIQKSSLNLDAGTLVVRHSLAQIYGKGLTLMEPKSEKSRRELAIPPFTVELLRRHLSVHSQNSDFVFATGHGTPFSPRNILRHFKLKLAEAGLPQTTRIHDLRHAFISWLISSGQDIKTIQSVAGHSQIQVTLDVYGHLMPGALRSAADKVQGMFGG
jgi:integrase